MSEPLNSVALVLAGALFGAVATNFWCGCLPRWRWRRQWRALAERQGRDFSEQGHVARFIARCVAARADQRARDLARRTGTEATQ